MAMRVKITDIETALENINTAGKELRRLLSDYHEERGVWPYLYKKQSGFQPPLRIMPQDLVSDLFSLTKVMDYAASIVAITKESE